MQDSGWKDVTEGEESPLSFAVSERDRNILAVVRDAVASGRVRLAYQPVMQVARPEAPAFWEGLARVIDPTGRAIPARQFIHVVETEEVGRVLDCISLEIGLKALRDNPGLRLAINMSARSH